MKIMKLMKTGYSPIVGICGKQRTGKSTVGVWVANLIMSAYGKNFEPEKNTFYEPVKTLERLDKASYEAWLVDEAGDLLNRREWYDQSHQALSSMVQTQGYKTMCYIFISPFIIDIDSNFTKHFDFVLRVDERGRFKAFQYIKRYDSIDNKKVLRRIFLDDVSLSMNCIPKDIWNRYHTYSISQKNIIRAKRLTSLNKNDKKTENDPIKKLRVDMRVG